LKSLCNICKNFKHTDVHHIISKSCGGSNEKSNLTDLCPNCHRSVHCGEIIIEGKFNSTQGRRLVWRQKEQNKIIKEFLDPHTHIV